MPTEGRGESRPRAAHYRTPIARTRFPCGVLVLALSLRAISVGLRDVVSRRLSHVYRTPGRGDVPLSGGIRKWPAIRDDMPAGQPGPTFAELDLATGGG